VAVPSDLANLVAWYDASAITGLVDTDPVATWSDLSGAGNHISQATGASRPTYRTGIVDGKPVVRFDGSNDLLAATMSTSATATVLVVAVPRRTSPSSSYVETIFANGSSADQVQQLDTKAFGTTSLSVHTDTGAWGATVALRKNGATSPLSLTVDEVFAASMTASGAPTGSVLVLGAYSSNNFHGQNDIAEFVYYSRVLDASERESIETYLSEKWGLTEPTPEAAVVFTATATAEFTAEPDDSVGAVAFTATATLTAETPVVVDLASVSFTGTGAFEVTTRPFGIRRRLVVVDIHGEPFGELDNAICGAVTYRLGEPEEFSFVLPVGDPKAHLLLDDRFREVQLWRGDQLLAWGPAVRPSADKHNLAVTVRGVQWYLTRRAIGKAARTNHLVNGDMEDGTIGWRIGALSPFEPLTNRNPANWSATTATDRVLTGRRSLRLEQLASGVPKYGVQASQFLVWEVDPDLSREGDEWTLVAYCYIPSADWRGPPPDGIGIRLDRYSTTETVITQPEGGGAVETLPKPIESVSATIDDDTPRDVWTRLEKTLVAPVTGDPEFVSVTLGCPDGAIYWDRAGLSLDERLAFWGTDQAVIAETLVEHLQDPAYGKSDLNLSTDMPATGVLRDRVFPHHEHQIGADALNELTTLDNGFDLSVAYTATTRTIRTHHPRRGSHRPGFALELGRNVADFAWTFDGENAANTVVVLGTGDGSDREEASAVNPSAYADGLTLETVFSAPPDTPIDSLDNVATETLTVATGPDLLSVSLTAAQPGQRDPIGILAPGDTVPVTLRAGALTVSDTYRIVELTITPNDTLELTLNRRDQ
jgi:hypothetical protein